MQPRKHSPKELKTAKQWHLHWVYLDPEFRKKVAQLKEPPRHIKDKGDSWRQPYQELAEEFCVDYGDVFSFKRNGKQAIVLRAGLVMNGFAFYKKDWDCIQIQVRKDVTKKDFLDLWRQVHHIQKTVLKLKTTRRKAPENSQLLYAIFKARKRGDKYSKIFKDYERGTLKYFEGKSAGQFLAQEDLERYYRKYMPYPGPAF